MRFTSNRLWSKCQSKLKSCGMKLSRQFFMSCPIKILSRRWKSIMTCRRDCRRAIFTTDLREAEYFRQPQRLRHRQCEYRHQRRRNRRRVRRRKRNRRRPRKRIGAWKNYMRRQTSTLYYGTEKPALAQGIIFRCPLVPIALDSNKKYSGHRRLCDDTRADAALPHIVA